MTANLTPGPWLHTEEVVAYGNAFARKHVKIYNEQITVQSKMPREIINISTQVKAAMEKSWFRDGIVLVSSPHSNSAVIVSDEEPGFLEDLDSWLLQMAPARGDYKHQGRFESNSSPHLQSLLLHHPVIVAFTEGRLDPWALAVCIVC